MIKYIKNKKYLIEVLPPKQDTKNLEEDLEKFNTRYGKVINDGYCACITDNAMGHLYFQGTEIIEEFNLPAPSEQVVIHLNTFHRKDDLDNILNTCQLKGIKYLLVVTGDGSVRLPKLRPIDLDLSKVDVVTSVELIEYINREYPNIFVLGVAFNPYEPEEHEFEKMERKIKAGATFIITQPLLEENLMVNKLIKKYPEIPIFIEAWMSKNLHLLSEAVGYEIVENEDFEPISTLKMLHNLYPQCGVYLSLLGFKSQFNLIQNTWI